LLEGLVPRTKLDYVHASHLGTRHDRLPIFSNSATSSKV
jgi:hypothetical protein